MDYIVELIMSLEIRYPEHVPLSKCFLGDSFYADWNEGHVMYQLYWNDVSARKLLA